jgi:hypothetical protein
VDDVNISGANDNKGMDKIKDLVRNVRAKFGPNTFTAGDIISLAGKVAIEKTFPCMTIEWKSGRPPCVRGTERIGGPGPEINTFGKYTEFSTRYDLSALDFAILTTVAHSLKNSRNRITETQIASFLFASENNIIDFILQMMNPNGWISFTFSHWYGVDERNPDGIGRFESDFFMFPTTLARIDMANIDNSQGARDLEAFFTGIATSPTGKDDILQQFSEIYGRMLSIGTKVGVSLQSFSGHQFTRGQC